MYNEILEKHFISSKGLTVDEYFNPTIETTKSMLDMSKKIKELIRLGKTFRIIGDFDCDGICSTSIMVRGIHSLGGIVHYRIPERLTEGYGMSTNMVEETVEDVIITVDNGISCIEAIKKAKELGKIVLVIDHHEPYTNKNGEIVIPDADIIVNHKLTHDTKTDYCGAGLCYRIICNMNVNINIQKKCSVLACLGTIADVVDVKFDNRNIIKEGLDIMNNQYVNNPYGISALMKLQNLSVVNTHNIGFRLTPVINAAGRMKKGAVKDAMELLLTDKKDFAFALAPTLIELNEQRKKATEKGIQIVDEIIKNECRYGENPLIIHNTDIYEGVSGIVAGRISEREGITTGIFSTTYSSNKEEIYKGSFRSPHINIKKLLDDCNSTIYKYGGHKKAAGASIKACDFDNFVSMISNKDISNYIFEEDDSNIIINVPANDITVFFKELSAYEPFGEGNKSPLVRITDMELYPRNGEFYTVMGENNDTVKLYGKNFSAIWYENYENYKNMGNPHHINVMGEIQSSFYGRNMEIQLLVDEIKKINVNTDNQPTSLGSVLLSRMKLL